MNTRDNIYVRIRFLYPSLTKSEKLIADLILKEKQNFVNYTMAEVSKTVCCSDATVVRFCRRLNQNGFIELKRELQEAEKSSYDNGKFRIEKDDALPSVFEKIIWYYKQMLNDTKELYSRSDYEGAYNAIRNAKSIHFFGVGDAMPVCKAAEMKFMRIGIPCSAHSDLAFMSAQASMLGKDDVAMAISYSGDTKILVDCMRLAKQNGAKTIAIIHCEKSKIEQYIDYSLYTAVTDMSDAHEEIARRVAENAIVETLYMKLVTSEEGTYKEHSKKSIAAIIANKN